MPTLDDREVYTRLDSKCLWGTPPGPRRGLRSLHPSQVSVIQEGKMFRHWGSAPGGLGGKKHGWFAVKHWR